MKDFREYLNELKNSDDLIEIDTEVDPVIEIAKIQKEYANSKTVLFNKIKGYDIPVVCNILLRVSYLLPTLKQVSGMFLLPE